MAREFKTFMKIGLFENDVIKRLKQQYYETSTYNNETKSFSEMSDNNDNKKEEVASNSDNRSSEERVTPPSEVERVLDMNLDIGGENEENYNLEAFDITLIGDDEEQQIQNFQTESGRREYERAAGNVERGEKEKSEATGAGGLPSPGRRHEQ